jgi:hypothetical protein
MAKLTHGSGRKCWTICLPIAEDHYRSIMNSWPDIRSWLLQAYQETPELFPAGFDLGFTQRDSRMSKKLSLRLWRITLNRAVGHYSVRPSFVTPHMTALTETAEKGLFLRKFGVSYDGIATVEGRNRMFWYRLESSLGRNSLVGTTVRRGALPKHLAADEHHQKRKRAKIFIATTVGAGCCLGAAVAAQASADVLIEAYDIFRAEAWDVAPDYAPESVNTDGWKGTIAAWRHLFENVALLRCFLHGWLKIRDRGKHLADFQELGDQVWNAYEAANVSTFRRRLRKLKRWSEEHLPLGPARTEVLDLCAKEHLWEAAYAHPNGHRTSNMLDRIMRKMCRFFDQGQHLHGSLPISNQRARAWALLHNFLPWSAQSIRRNGGCKCPAERFNGHRYHSCWLQNLLISASLGGYRNFSPEEAEVNIIPPHKAG